MRVAGVVLFLSSGLAAFAYSFFRAPGGPTPTPPHWVAAPLLAFTIVLSMGCLVVLTTAGGGRDRR